ncbi:Ig-like domain-containing protein, partial [uncultured Clostridium sp.]|uniref:Ig-like domain-containing protein n=1 Tax=uncultured Clostridium sp. TaxID=59620 RepID=UPI0028E849AF
MNKYLKKFGIMFVMTLAIIGIGAIQNGVLAKAATVGSALTSPESGWTRYDDTNTKIKYVGGWGNSSFTPYYGGTMHYTTGTGKNNYAKIKFYGSEFRLIGKRDVNSSILNINIDGKDYLDDNTTPSSSNIWQALTFEKRDLGFGVHDVTITNIKSKHMQIDAIDIDNTGYLIDPNESITLDKSSINLNVGDSQKLAATTVPAGAQVTWTSSDGSIATVDPNGNVTGVSGGTCTITATTADGLTATCTANVNKEDESITLDKSSMELNQGDSGQLTATVSTTTSAQVTWTSSNPSAATVDSTGKVTAIGAGTATITATTTDGSNLSASCT